MRGDKVPDNLSRNAAEPSAVRQIHGTEKTEGKIDVAGQLEDCTIVPVLEEQAVVHRQTRATDWVRVRTIVHVDEEAVDTTVSSEEIEVERVALDRWVEAPIPVRHEGYSTIITLHQEVVVTEKRLKAIGEVRMTRRLVTQPNSERVALRREEAIVERAVPAPDENNTPS